MKTRCYNKKTKSYSDYGARGIIVCDKWKTFAGFYDDMGASYKEGLTIDRIDNNGNYTLENCKWSTKKEQCNNRRSSKIIEFNNDCKTLAQWIEFFNLKSSTVRQRYCVYGWPVERCFKQ